MREGEAVQLPVYGRAGVVAHVLVDVIDAPIVRTLRLNLARGGYAVFYKKIDGRLHAYKLHRSLLAAPGGLVVDHINHDPLDNRRENLRLCTSAENSRNRKLDPRNKTGFKGVSRNRHSFVATIQVNRKLRHLGSFASAIEAARRYDEAAIALHGEFALLNFATAVA